MKLYVPHPVDLLLFINVPLITAITTIETITTTMRDTTTTKAATAPRLRVEELPAWGIDLDYVGLIPHLLHIILKLSKCKF